MRDQLVATGDATLDAFLLLARGVRHPQRKLEDAESALDEAQRRDREHNGFHGTAEARQRAERSYGKAKQAITDARRAEDQAERTAQAAALPRLFALANAEVEAMWNDFYGRRDPQRYRDDKGMPDDDTLWCDLEPGAEVHIRYATTGQVMVWQFVELGEEHPENEELRIARYVESSRWRAVPDLVELAVHPEDLVGLHARSDQMTIIQPRKEQV
ncbi:hypothetical protein AB0L53_47010 [Nonomuraea sp. NPDC052129]|uniref:hypothetical protein n=1 Tax=Nonomuraea sp. NPDC052129 TaxID=3154651 RepID=UPI00342DA28D